MYEEFKQKGLPYYNVEGKLLFYRFRKEEALKLLEEFKKNNEYILGVTIFDNPSKEDYGQFSGTFDCNQDINDTLDCYKKIEEYISKIKDKDNCYFEFTLKSNNISPSALAQATRDTIKDKAKHIDDDWVQCSNKSCEEVFPVSSEEEYLECPKCFKIQINPLYKTRI